MASFNDIKTGRTDAFDAVGNLLRLLTVLEATR